MNDWRGVFDVVAMVALLAVGGCKPKEQTTATPAAAVPAEEVMALRTALARGMQAISLAGLAPDHVGRSCVVVARTPEKAARPDAPPPLGMVRILGTTIIYKGQIHAISAEGIEVHAVYPNSGKLKIVAVPAADIQSIHLGK
jgi:hypothetical protein